MQISKMIYSRFRNILRNYSTTVKTEPEHYQFEPVFSFPYVKYISLVNRLKIYHIYGSGVVIPSTGLMEMFQVLPEHSFFAASYIGVTGAAVLTLLTLPLKNIIGHLYISDDNEFIKISYVSFSGKRIDKIITAKEWVPILDLEPRKTDTFYLRPELTDGTKYKLFINFGNVKNSQKMSEVLE